MIVAFAIIRHTTPLAIISLEVVMLSADGLPSATHSVVAFNAQPRCHVWQLVLLASIQLSQKHAHTHLYSSYEFRPQLGIGA